jgi:hypothetical protein
LLLVRAENLQRRQSRLKTSLQSPDDGVARGKHRLGKVVCFLSEIEREKNAFLFFPKIFMSNNDSFSKMIGLVFSTPVDKWILSLVQQLVDNFVTLVPGLYIKKTFPYVVKRKRLRVLI